MNRRDFLAATVGGLVLVGAPPWLGSLRAEPGVLAQGQRAMHVRHNVYCLSPMSREIRSYARAVQVMQARAATDPTSWSAQAAIHGTLTPTPGMIVNQCEHGTRFFFSWHRMFLYYFERIVRHAAGDPAFALPYWGYTPTGDRALPIPFRSPADATNPLYVAGRRAAVNAGNPLAASTVDAGVALAQVAFNSFSSSLEGTPHGVVHVAVGGWMGSVPTAGQDPIFWLHHANIDRLWHAWIATGGGRANPTDAPWLTRSYDFYDETGARVSLTGTQVLDAARQLRYRYAPDVCGRGVTEGFDRQALERLSRIPPDARRNPRADAVRRRPPLPRPRTLAQAQEPVSLGSTAAEVRLPVPAEARALLAAFLTDPKAGNELLVSLEDIRVEGTPSVFYEIYVNLPVVEDTVYTMPHYLGNLDFFGAADRPQERRFNLVPVYLQLQDSKGWVEDTVRLTFVPRAFTEGEDPAQLLGERTQAVVGRALIHAQ